MPLNFGGRKRSGAFDTVWPSADMLMMMSSATEMNLGIRSPRDYGRLYKNESASCGLDSLIGLMRCCGMPKFIDECLVVPVSCSASRFSKQCSSANLWFFGSAVPAASDKDFCPRVNMFKE